MEDLFMLVTEERMFAETNKWENRLIKKCKLCNKTGIIKKNGEYVNCECSNKAKLFTKLTCNGVPTKYLQWRWKDCDDQSFVNECKDYADKFIDYYMEGTGLFLYGLQGRGKTTMESLIARDATIKINPDTNKSFEVIFVMFEDLIQWNLQKNDWVIRNKLNNVIENSDLLIIDNLGSETGFGSETKTNVKLLDRILRTRDNNQKPFIISSNFTLEEIGKYYSETIKDFIYDDCKVIDVTGEKFRNTSEYNNWGV